MPGLQTKDAQKTAGDYASQVSHPAPPIVLHQWLPSKDLAVVGLSIVYCKCTIT